MNGLFYVAAGGIPRYGIMECADIYISANSGGTTEFFRPEAVYRLRGFFYLLYAEIEILWKGMVKK